MPTAAVLRCTGSLALFFAGCISYGAQSRNDAGDEVDGGPGRDTSSPDAGQRSDDAARTDSALPHQPSCLELENARRDSIELKEPGDIAALHGVEIIEGNLHILGATLQDLRGLSSLRQIRGNLGIDAASLRSLEGLENLARIEGRLELSGPRLRVVDTLASLEFACRIEFVYVSSLEEVTLPALRTAGSLSVFRAPRLSRINLPRLERLFDGRVAYDHPDLSLDLSWNPRLTFVGLASLAEVGHSVRIYSNDALETLDVSALREVTGDLRLISNREHVRLPRLEHVGGSLEVNARTLLDLDSLRNGGTVDLETLPDGTVNAPMLESVEVGFSVAARDQTIAAANFPRLARGRHFAIRARDARFPALNPGDAAYVTLSGLESFDLRQLRSVRWLRADSSAQGIASLPLRSAETIFITGGHFVFPDLTDIAIIEVTNTESVSVPALRTIRRLNLGIGAASIHAPLLTTIEADLGVMSTALTTLRGLPMLERIGQRLIITNNPSFTELALDRLTSVGTAVSPAVESLRITGNRTLRQCEAMALLERLRGSGFDAVANVAGNGGAGGCP